MPNGKVVKALTAKELTESFKKIVINLYGEKWNAFIKIVITIKKLLNKT